MALENTLENTPAEEVGGSGSSASSSNGTALSIGGRPFGSTGEIATTFTVSANTTAVHTFTTNESLSGSLSSTDSDLYDIDFDIITIVKVAEKIPITRWLIKC